MTPPDRLRSTVLRQAVESNLDTIHDRLPLRLRPSYRWSQRLRRWLPGSAAVLGILAVLGLARSTPAPPRSARGERVAGLSAAGTSAGTAADPLLDSATASRPVAAAAARVAGSDEASAEAVAALANARPFAPDVLHLSVRRVVIDAGHGGDSRGTASDAGALEKTFTLDIAERMRTEIESRGFTTLMTRTDDKTVSLQRRAEIANSGGGDVFVSIHLNWFEIASMTGIETYYLGPGDGAERDTIAERENQHSGYSMADLRSMLDRIFTDTRRDESRQLAGAVQRALMDQMRQTGAHAIDRGVKQAPFVVLVATDMPAILAEVSCLSNKDEVARLNEPEYRQRIAEALATGVATFARARG